MKNRNENEEKKQQSFQTGLYICFVWEMKMLVNVLDVMRVKSDVPCFNFSQFHVMRTKILCNNFPNNHSQNTVIPSLKTVLRRNIPNRKVFLFSFSNFAGKSFC